MDASENLESTLENFLLDFQEKMPSAWSCPKDLVLLEFLDVVSSFEDDLEMPSFLEVVLDIGQMPNEDEVSLVMLLAGGGLFLFLKNFMALNVSSVG